MPHRTVAAVVLLLVLALGAGCGADEEAGPPASSVVAPEGPDLGGVDFVDETGAGEVEVDAVDNTFIPDYVEVHAGTAITFRNDGRNDHNVLPVRDGAFSEVPTEAFGPEAEATVTFDEPGDFAYYCSLHGTPTKGMVGAVRVVE